MMRNWFLRKKNRKNKWQELPYEFYVWQFLLFLWLLYISFGCNRLGLTELLHLLQTYVKKNALSPCVSLQNKVLLNEMF